MKLFCNLKISVKLIMSFVLVAVITCILGVVSMVNMNKMESMDMNMYKEHTSTMDDLAEVAQSYQLERVSIRDFIIRKDSGSREKIMSQFKDLDKKIDSSLNILEGEVKDPKIKSSFYDLKNSLDEFKKYRDAEVNLVNLNKDDEALSNLYNDGTRIASAVQSNIDNLLKLKVEAAGNSANENANTFNFTFYVMIAASLVSMVVAIGLGIFMAGVIGNPIKKLVQISDKLADGDIDVEITANTKDEIGNLTDSFNKIIKTIRELVAEQTKLNEAVDKGELRARGDEHKFNGSYREIIAGTNRTLDSISIPIDEAKSVLSKLEVNDYTVEMTGKYNGMFKEFSESINNVRTRLLNIQDIFNRISKGDTSRLEEYKKIGKRSANDQIAPAAIMMMEAVENLIVEAEELADSAVNGNLSIRGKLDKFNGRYKDVIEGMNKTMNAVVKPINEATAVIQEVSNGNLTCTMNGEYKGEYAKLSSALNSTIKSLNELLNDINNSSEQVASGSQQIADSAQALSQGSTEQASAVEELTASMEEISAQTKQNAVNANQANEMALTAKQDAIYGNNYMHEMIDAMNSINESSSNISKIIKVIEEIAFQTNILALNAAVEAARAGQHGKGFAVVAEEVRNLAARSSNAAKETTALIEGSINKVEEGTKVASKTAEALNKIVDEVTQVVDVVGEIAVASSEQDSGIQQVNQGIIQVSQVIQSNSATSEESASASEELASQAGRLKELVGKFRLNKNVIDNNALNVLSPEVLKMLENMSMGKTKAFVEPKEVIKPNNDSKIKINLSDTDFGKY